MSEDADFMIGQSNHDVQNEPIDSFTDRGTYFDNTNILTQINYLQVDMHTLDESIVSKRGSEVDIVITSVETRVQDVVLTAVEN